MASKIAENRAGTWSIAWRIALVLFFVVAAVYVPSLRNGFVYDDEPLILEQARPETVSDVFSVFTERHFPGLPYYRPVTRFTFVVQKALHGNNALPYHLVNALLMGCVAVAAYGLLCLPVFRVRRLPAFLAALIFSVHPVAAMTVYPICSGRETLLPAGLMILAMTGYLHGSRKGRVAAWLLFGCALFAKEQAIVLPVMFVAADAFGLTRLRPGFKPGAWVRRTWPVIPILAVYLPIRLFLFSGVELQTELSVRPLRPVMSYLYAVQVFFAPFRDVVYEPPVEIWLSWPRLALAGVLAAALLLAVWRGARRSRRQVLFWMAWFIVLQLPTANLLRQEAKFAERYVFLASLGILAVAARLLSAHWERPAVRRVAVTAMVAVAVILAGVSISRCGSFVDDYAFSLQWVETNPNASIALNNLGNELIKQDRLDEAEVTLRRSIAADAGQADPYFNLGLALYKQGRVAEAIPEYRAALERKPTEFIEYNLALALADVGATNEAISVYRVGLVKKPEHADSHFNLGLLLSKKGDIRSGLEHVREAVRLEPDDPEAAYNLGVAYEALDRDAEAAEAYEHVVALDPSHVNAHYNLANLCFRGERYEEAVRYYRAVLAVDPADRQARINMEAALDRVAARKAGIGEQVGGDNAQ